MSPATAEWFAVDRKGLADILARKGRGAAVVELLSNCLDQDVTKVTLELTPLDGKRAKLVAEDDDPEGFADLRLAYTLFAPSTKRKDPSKRGRFTIGEKLVLAGCEEATITSTKGTVIFDKDGRRESRKKRERGSRFEATIRLDAEEIEAVAALLRQCIVPAGIEVTYNGEQLTGRESVGRFEAVLPTDVEVDGPDGQPVVKRLRRKTEVKLYEPLDGEVASVYELGIPVVETGDRWHYDVGQKVPLNMERDNVPPGFLRDLRANALNVAHEELSEEDASSTWVKEAVGSGDATPEAVKTTVTKRFGEKVVAYDPNDREGSKLAMSMGYTVVTGGVLSKQEWKAVRAADAIMPAGQVTPSPGVIEMRAQGVKPIDPAKWTPNMKRVAAYCGRLGQELLGRDVEVRIHQRLGGELVALNTVTQAAYTPGLLLLSLSGLGSGFFESPRRETIDALMLHEFAHELEKDHLSDGYHRAMGTLGAKLRTCKTTIPEKA